MIENLESRRLLSASVTNGILTITGTDKADRINVVQRGAAVVVHEGSSITRFAKRDHISSIVINALGGNDQIKVTSKIAATIDGGDGNDLIVGGNGGDVLLGGNGKDRILGQDGNDSISGGAGRDALFGGAGDDMLDALDTEADQLTGGAGKDSARVDSQTDKAWNIEEYLSLTTNSLGAVTDISGGASVVHINAGKLIIDPVTNPGSGSLFYSGGTSLGGSGTITGSVQISPGTHIAPGDGVTTLTAGTLSVNGSALNLVGGASGIDRILLSGASASNTLTLSNINAFNLLNFGNASGDYLLINYGGSLAGFTVGTYRLFTMTSFTDGGDIVIGTNNDPGAFTYPVIEVTPIDSNSSGHIDPVLTEVPATDPAVLTAPQSPSVDESPAQTIVEDPTAPPLA